MDHTSPLALAAVAVSARADFVIIRQHIPTFVDGVVPREGSFSNLDGLVAIDFVKSHIDHHGFHRLSLDGNLLMAEYRNGREWWVIGHLDFGPSWLPKFRVPPDMIDGHGVVHINRQ